MIINHPLLGPRDAQEFTYLGDATLINRPYWLSENALRDFHDYLHLRDNPAGQTRDLWHHEGGCGSWLVVTRDTVSHAIESVALAADVKRGQA